MVAGGGTSERIAPLRRYVPRQFYFLFLPFPSTVRRQYERPPLDGGTRRTFGLSFFSFDMQRLMSKL